MTKGEPNPKGNGSFFCLRIKVAGEWATVLLVNRRGDVPIPAREDP